MKCINRFVQKKLSCFALAVSMVFSAALAGCGEEEPLEVVELHEPEKVVMGTETVRLRNLYDATVYEASVYPYTEDYSFEEWCYFASYGAIVGEKVRKGTPLAYADMESVRRKREAAEERLASMQAEYEEYCAKTAAEILEWEKVKNRAEEIVENLDNEMPDEYLLAQNEENGEDLEPEPDGDVVDIDGPAIPEEDGATNQETVKVPNPEYAVWEAQRKKWVGEAALYGYYIDVAEEELSQRAELYALDYAYYDSERAKLQAEEQKGILVSQMAGTVISMAQFLPGDDVTKGKIVATVGDLERKTVRCPAIPNVTLTLQRAQEVYAFFGGRRYEIAYQENDKDGYSVFSLSENTEMSVGDYGVVVVVTNSRTQVPSLSAAAIYTDGVRKYVYVQESGQSVEREVKTGMSDGIYTEILSGVEEGEVVLLARPAEENAEKTAVLERGTYGMSYIGSGKLYYPRKTLVANPVTSGTVYFQKSLVSAGQYVKKGDVITAIRVEGDELGLLRLETDIKRAKERLADLAAGGTEGKEAAIAQREEQIAAMENRLAVLKEDYAQTEIRVPVSGIVDKCFLSAEETVLNPKETVAQISDIKSGYLVLNTYLLNYGDTLTVTYRGWDGESHTTTGTVVSLGALSGGNSRAVRNMLVALPDGEIERVEAAAKTQTGEYSVNALQAEGFVKTMENVVLVPKAAVTVKDGYTYVNILEKDGSVTSVSFLAGGSNADYYWVIEGLTEGMRVCWE